MSGLCLTTKAYSQLSFIPNIEGNFRNYKKKNWGIWVCSFYIVWVSTCKRLIGVSWWQIGSSKSTHTHTLTHTRTH